jgi:hypothetical protein
MFGKSRNDKMYSTAKTQGGNVANIIEQKFRSPTKKDIVLKQNNSELFGKGGTPSAMIQRKSSKALRGGRTSQK